VNIFPDFFQFYFVELLSVFGMSWTLLYITGCAWFMVKVWLSMWRCGGPCGGVVVLVKVLWSSGGVVVQWRCGGSVPV